MTLPSMSNSCDDVEDVRVVDRVACRAGSAREGSVVSPVIAVNEVFGAQAVRGAELVVVPDAVVAAALDVDRAEVLDAA